jgi:DNA-binding IclR family transcriptional regulator
VGRVPGIQSIERAFAVLARLSSGPAGVTELAERVDLPKSTVSRLLSTLEAIGAVEQVSVNGPYRIGAKLHQIAAAAMPDPRLIDIARPHLEELVRATGEASGLSVADGDDVLYLAQVEARGAIQVRDWTGERIPMHVVSSGLVLLAWAGEDRIEDYLSRPLVRFTKRSMTDPDALRERLRDVRERGFAWVIEEYADALNSVAAPVHNAHGDVVAAVHVHGPAFRFPGCDAGDATATRIGRTVASAADRVSQQWSER